mmetsp:Transcript_5844/g.9142  ORF Transcript_5844/g.9142 Transcript_5844/m.9142 type:complete len:205 (-) Transcript_5844:164-778(-)
MYCDHISATIDTIIEACVRNHIWPTSSRTCLSISSSRPRRSCSSSSCNSGPTSSHVRLLPSDIAKDGLLRTKEFPPCTLPPTRPRLVPRLHPEQIRFLEAFRKRPAKDVMQLETSLCSRTKGAHSVHNNLPQERQWCFRRMTVNRVLQPMHSEKASFGTQRADANDDEANDDETNDEASLTASATEDAMSAATAFMVCDCDCKF